MVFFLKILYNFLHCTYERVPKFTKLCTNVLPLLFSYTPIKFEADIVCTNFFVDSGRAEYARWSCSDFRGLQNWNRKYPDDAVNVGYKPDSSLKILRKSHLRGFNV